MSKIAEYRALEAKIAEQLAQLESLKNNENFKRDIEFEKKLRTLMEQYGIKLKGIIALLSPQTTATTTLKSGQRRQRDLKIYKHPQTGEVVETKGGNHKTLKAWKVEFGAETVEGWRQ